MTKKEALLAQALRRITMKSTGNTETDHGEADDLLLEFINDGEVSLAYDNIKKWYG